MRRENVDNKKSPPPKKRKNIRHHATIICCFGNIQLEWSFLQYYQFLDTSFLSKLFSILHLFYGSTFIMTLYLVLNGGCWSKSTGYDIALISYMYLHIHRCIQDRVNINQIYFFITSWTRFLYLNAIIQVRLSITEPNSNKQIFF